MLISAVIVAAVIAPAMFSFVKAQGGPRREKVITTLFVGGPAVTALLMWSHHWHGGESSSTVAIDAWALVAVEYVAVFIIYRWVHRPWHHLVEPTTGRTERRRTFRTS